MKKIAFIISLFLFSTPAFPADVGAPYQIQRMPSSGHRPGYGTIDLSQSAAVGSSVLGPSNGGLGLNGPCSLGLTPTGNGGGYSCQAPGKTAPTIQSFTVSGVTTTGNLSTSSVCITSPGTTIGINPGASVIDSTHSAAIPVGYQVVAVPGTCSSGQIQMNVAASLAETGDTLIFGSEPITTGTISNSSVCVTSVGTSAGIVPGAPVYDISTPTAITLGTVVVAMPGTCSASQIQMSANAATSESGDTLAFGGVYNTPSANPLFLEITILGGGGSGATVSAAGLSGALSSFASLLIAGPGGGGVGPAGSGGTGAGSGPVVNSPAIPIFSVKGGGGGSGVHDSGNLAGGGGVGCSSPLGGAGSGGGDTAPGGNAANNSGSGGGGQGLQVAGSTNSGSGGGCGDYIKAQLNSPSASYPYFVGFGGLAGSGLGGSGGLTVAEKYQ